MQVEPLFGTPGMITVLASFRRHNGQAGTAKFPTAPEWRGVGHTCNSESPREFFVRLVGEAEASGHSDDANAIQSCQLADGVAIFIQLEWSGERLLKCSIQAVAAPGSDLETLYLDGNSQGVYYRFDYSVQERGCLFDHPFPHVHSVPEGGPRFPFRIPAGVFPPLAFLEFVMINHGYENWSRWILSEYSKRYSGEVPDNEPTPEQLIEAYKVESDWLRIDENYRARFISRLKHSSRDALLSLSVGYPLIDSENCTVNYWHE